MIALVRDWTGRRWINIGRGLFAVGFGPRRFIERVVILRRWTWAARP